MIIRCERWRRKDGAFSFGPVEWTKCENVAIVNLTVVQNDEAKEFPICMDCWREAVKKKIKIVTVSPMPKVDLEEKRGW